jgi:23S rRNA pseudouridine1911/1915/1917 synthase
MSNEIKFFTVSDESAGMRLDKFLADNLPDFSRSEVQRFKIDTVPAGGKIKLSAAVRAGDEYSVEIPEQNQKSEIINHKSNIDLDVMFEDDDIIVVNKPRGIVMYPSAGNKTGTLVQNILAHTHLSGLGGEIRPGVVHRLDKDTSGAVILAKSDAAFRVLVKTFAAHDLTRKYVAIIWGVPNWESADITGNIARSTKNRQKMTMVKIGGKTAHTIVDVMNVWPRDGVSMVKCTLMTGRTHQIRVHLSSHGFPVLCDPVYGRGNSRLGSLKNMELLDFVQNHHGQMLHAEILELNHPVTGERLHFRARRPDDMTELLDILNN